MDNGTTASYPTSDKLANPLAASSDLDERQSGEVRGQTRRELLNRLLSEPLPAALSTEGGRTRGDAPAMVAIIAPLKGPAPDLSQLQEVKDYGKRLSVQAGSRAEHDVANAIYYAAIARALVCHDTRITKFSYDELAQSLKTLSSKTWVPQGLRGCFADASRYCLGRTEMPLRRPATPVR